MRRAAGRFDGKHDKHFSKTDSIATHYAARRPDGMSTSTSTQPSHTESGNGDVVRVKDTPAERRKLDTACARRSSTGRRTSVTGPPKPLPSTSAVNNNAANQKPEAAGKAGFSTALPKW